VLRLVPLFLVSDTPVMFGFWEQFSLPAGITTLPIFVWELSLGIYLVVKGVKPLPVTAAGSPPAIGQPTTPPSDRSRSFLRDDRARPNSGPAAVISRMTT